MALSSAVDILLVEDDANDAELCLRALRKNNLTDRIVWAKDGAEALDLLFGMGGDDSQRIAAPKVILLDLRMPRVDGLEVLRRLKADPRTRSFPVVALTSSKEDRDIAQAYGLGVNSFISKPIEFEAFAETVARLGFYWLVVNRPPS
jgi:CheY-like chemotaxis protein